MKETVGSRIREIAIAKALKAGQPAPTAREIAESLGVRYEMIKRRPVVVASRHETHNRRLCLVVPLSTTSPSPVRSWHHPLPHVGITGWQPSGVMWAKCDMLATVSMERLNKPYVKTRHGRNYVTHKLDDADMAAVLAGIRAFLGL